MTRLRITALAAAVRRLPASIRKQRGFISPALLGVVASRRRSSASGLLGGYTANLWGAYGLEQLLSTATLAIKVRRSSDNTEQDIGFSGTALDTAALATFVGANDGFITRWYDQSGNGNYLEQSTAANQPMIVDAGTYTEELLFDGTSDRLVSVNNGGTPSACTVFFGGRDRTPDVSTLHAMFDRASTALAINIQFSAGESDLFLSQVVFGSATNDYPDSSNVDNATYAYRYDYTQASLATKIRFFVNGSSQTAALSSSGTAPTSITAGAWYLGSNSSASTFTRTAAKTFLIYETAVSDSDVAAISTLIRPIPPSDGFDSYTTNLWGLYSLRRQLSAYAGSSIRVRRSSDSTEQDIGFTSGLLDTASLLSFCGAGDGFVKTFYDQSGAGNDFSQATTTKQAKIVASGALLPKGLTFDGTDDAYATAANNGTPSAVSIYAKAEQLVFANAWTLLETPAAPFTAGNQGIGVGGNGHISLFTTHSGAAQYVIADYPNSNPVLNVYCSTIDRALAGFAQCALYSGGAVVTRTGGGTAGVSPSGVVTSSPWYLGGRGATSIYLNGSVETLAIYTAVHAAATVERVSRQVG